MEPLSKARVKVVGQIYGEQCACRTRINAHIICRVVEEFSTRVPLDVMRVVVTPAELHINPVFS